MNIGFFGGSFDPPHIGHIKSAESFIKEAKLLTEDSEFKGYIHDVGGPTANFRRSACDKQEKQGACKNKQCLLAKPCKNLICDHSEYLSLLKDRNHKSPKSRLCSQKFLD